MQMHANDTNEKDEKIIYRDLSYQLTGLFYKAHNTLGQYCREKQYGDAIEKLLHEKKFLYQREKPIPVPLVDNAFTNRVDFSIEDKILLDIKAKRFVTKDDYYQMQRYLQASGYKLGLIVNFRNKYLKPIRIIRINS